MQTINRYCSWCTYIYYQQSTWNEKRSTRTKL